MVRCLLILFSWILLLLIGGYFLPAVKNSALSRTVAWLFVALTILISILLTADQGPVIRMIIIVSLLLLSMKVVVLNETYTGSARLDFIQWSAFSLAWFGMRPALFEALPSRSLTSKELIIKGVWAIVLGIVALRISALVEFNGLHSFSCILILLGLSLVLHFGLLNLVTGIWRVCGVDVKELFLSPYKAKSLNEFWGKRWNLAFSEMTSLVIFRPLRKKYQPAAAMVAAFLFSGLLHEIAISFPVKSGYGLPFLYFMIHAGVMLVEGKSPLLKRLLANNFAGRLWVLGWILLPMPLLFHALFIEQVLKPIRNVIVAFP